VPVRVGFVGEGEQLHVVDGDESVMEESFVVSLPADGFESEMEGMSNVFDGEMEPGGEGFCDGGDDQRQLVLQGQNRRKWRS
ncbi:hypothetical protein Dimus_013119, partial [Dionaea muscipula]